MLVTASTMSAICSRTAIFFIFVSCTAALVLRYGLSMVPIMPTRPSPSRPWKEVVADKLSADSAKIPEQWRLSADVIAAAKSRKQIAGDFIEDLLDAETRHVTSADAPDLVAAMANGSLTAVQVVTGYCKRAAFAHQLVWVDPSLPLDSSQLPVFC